MTSKQRKVLQALASKLQPIAQVGKGGVNDGLIKTLDEALEKRELIKLTVLNNSGEETGDVLKELAQKLNAIEVIAIGRKAVLYRRSKREDIEHIEF